MHKLYSYSGVDPSIKGGVLAIGNFDGVHLGHRGVLEIAMAEARSLGQPAGVMFFNPHPRQFFSPDTPLFMLTSSKQKLAQFEAIGLDFAVELSFDKALAGLSGEDFVKDVLVEGFGVDMVVIGYDFFFGRARGGNPALMEEFGREHNFKVMIVSPVGDEGLIFSSSGVRDALEEG